MSKRKTTIKKAQIESLQFELDCCAIELDIDFNSLKYIDYDFEQVAIRIDENRFLYSQNDEGIITNPFAKRNEYRTELMDYIDYKGEEDNAVSGYYDSLEHVKKEYPNDWKQIVVECAFEQMI